MNTDLLYRQALTSFLNRTGVLAYDNLASRNGWQITEKGLRRYIWVPNAVYFIHADERGGMELTWHEFHAVSQRKLRREGAEFAYLTIGEYLNPEPIMAQVQARIELDARLLASLDNALCVGVSPYYGDRQYESEEGFIHQSGHGRLTLCTEAEHIQWINHYERENARCEAFIAWQQNLRDETQRRVMA